MQGLRRVFFDPKHLLEFSPLPVLVAANVCSLGYVCELDSAAETVAIGPIFEFSGAILNVRV